MTRRARGRSVVLATALLFAACRSPVIPTTTPSTTPAPRPGARPTVGAVVPAPNTAQLSFADSFALSPTTPVLIDAAASADVERVAKYLAVLISGRSTAEPRRIAAGTPQAAGTIQLVLAPGGVLGTEGYDLTITHDRTTIRAPEVAGLFYGVQTFRQLLPVVVEHPAAIPRALKAPVGHIVDAPRFAWRGAMLDVSRHFFSVADVQRYIDLLAFYKLNRLHLHLSDDQGWRIEIASRPNLTRVGGSTQVGGGPGGFYTQANYIAIVEYARQRFVTVVPEIDMPGHTNAALASYPELNCDGVAPALFTGTRVGFSALCVDKEPVYAFIEDVVREIAAITAGPWFHIGGDEVTKLSPSQYRTFVKRVEAIVNRHGKRMVGWADVAPVALQPTTVVQHWNADSMSLHVARGGKVILSPATKLYLDMRYDSTTPLGLDWAGRNDVRQAYDWEPAGYKGLSETAILGVEAPLWSETLVKRSDLEYMSFPRLAALAEVGWSPRSARRWDSFRERLGQQGPRLAALGVNFYRSPEIPWRP